jgi:hypothetical protein
MMTISDLVNAISTVGFPIACCIVLFYETHQNAKRREEELTQMREILTDNTNTLKELVEYLKEER